MSCLSSVDCPLCKVKDKMQEDNDEQWIFYYCFNCGYGVYVTLVRDNNDAEFYKWDGRHNRQKFAKFINVTKRHKLQLIGKTLFYPLQMVLHDEYGVYPGEKNGKLAWKVYAMKKDKRSKLLGTFNTFRAADKAGEEYEDKTSKTEKGSS